MSEVYQDALSECPICYKSFSTTVIELHVDKCLTIGSESGASEQVVQGHPDLKRMKRNDGSPGSPATNEKSGNQQVLSAMGTPIQRDTNSGSRPAAVRNTRCATHKAPRTLMDMFSPKGPAKRSAISPPDSPATPPSPLTSQPAVSSALGQSAPERSNAGRPGIDSNKPLADRLRPDELAQFVGQSHILGAKSMLRTVIEADLIPSMVFWGPPGCGKTSLANIIAVHCRKMHNSKFIVMSATSAGVNDVKEVVRNAKNDFTLLKRKTILFIDEIHRFNKLQQDTFLPHVENGTLTLIGATTENPSFSLNSALLSRCRVFVLEKLNSADVELILRRAAQRLGVTVVGEGLANNGCDPKADEGSAFDDQEAAARGGDQPRTQIEKSALSALANLCDGDARTAINCFQLSVQSVQALASSHKGALITLNCIKESLQRTHLLYDKKGDEHYNCISALHKSMRGGHGDGALYWLGRMLQGGEDPLYVARRLVRFASEDIGLADPCALTQAVSTYQACHSIGMPECEVVLAQCVVYMSEAPKSIRVYSAYSKVKECIAKHEGPLPGVPLHLRNAPTKLMKNLGYGHGYKYNPVYDQPVHQEYLPDELKNVRFLSD